MAIWIYLRHYINIVLLYAVATTFRTVGPFELNWEAQQYKCRLSQYITFSLLASLQAINLFWLFLINRIAFNIVFRSTVEDVRSDDDGTEDEEEKRKGVAEARANAKEETKNAKALEAAPNGSAVQAVNGHLGKKEIESYPSPVKKEKKKQR